MFYNKDFSTKKIINYRRLIIHESEGEYQKAIKFQLKFKGQNIMRNLVSKESKTLDKFIY